MPTEVTTGFNTQPPEGGWFRDIILAICDLMVSTHSRLKAAGNGGGGSSARKIVSTHSRLKAAGTTKPCLQRLQQVSTHSRLKAAGFCFKLVAKFISGFNTQPPEGGWLLT